MSQPPEAKIRFNGPSPSNVIRELPKLKLNSLKNLGSFASEVNSGASTTKKRSPAPKKQKEDGSKDTPNQSILSKVAYGSPTFKRLASQDRSPLGRSDEILQDFDTMLAKSRSRSDKDGFSATEKGSAKLLTAKNNKANQDDYSSMLICFPSNIQLMSARDTCSNFNSFSELARTARNNSQDRRFNDIVRQGSQVGLPLSPLVQINKVALVKKVLDFNKTQKTMYSTQMENEVRGAIVPWIKQLKNVNKNTPKVRILPSRRIFNEENTDDNPNGMGTKDEILLVNPMLKHASSPSSPLPSSRTSERDKRRASQMKQLIERSFDEMFASYVYKAYWVRNYNNKSLWKPPVREGHTFTLVGRKMVLYGGVNNSLLNDIAIFDPVTSLWSKPKVTGEVPISGRHGHTACEFMNSIYIFGGEQRFNATLNIRECLNDVRMFSCEKNQWKYVRIQSSPIAHRRNHAATVHDRLMYVYGGINNEGRYIKDVWALHLKNCIWEQVDVSNDRESGMSFHAMCACFSENHSHNPKEKEKEKVKPFEQGIYVFGGKDAEGRILNTLKYFNPSYPHWRYPAVKGNPPVHRHSHSMVFVESMALIAIYGGRNDNLYQSTEDICHQDIKLLNLELMAWSNSTFHGDAPQVGRYLQTATVYGTRMYVFGGVEFQKYADDEVKIVELNQQKVKKLIESEQQEEDIPYGYNIRADGSLSPKRMRKKEILEKIMPLDESTFTGIVSFQPLPYKKDKSPPNLLNTKQRPDSIAGSEFSKSASVKRHL